MAQYIVFTQPAILLKTTNNSKINNMTSLLRFVRQNLDI